jgi:multiple sugar transport system ATP-binding protein
VQMRAEIASIQRRLGVTTIYVTHDQVEAMTMGHRVALMRDGILQQIDTPAEIYAHPRNMFVAAFIGSPTMNLYWADLGAGPDGQAALRFGSSALALPPSVLSGRPGLRQYLGRRLVLGVRPEDVVDPALPHAGTLSEPVQGRVELIEALGSDLIVHLGIDAQAAEVKSSDSLQELPAADGSRARCLARLSARSRVQEGQPLEVRFDLDRLHFFDGETGNAIHG